MGRIGFAMAAIGSLIFLGWFGYQENEKPGFGFAMAIIALPLLTALFGFSKSTAETIAKDGKGAAWAGLIIAAVGILYMFAFKSSWVLVAICWLLLQIPAVVAAAVSPTTPDLGAPAPDNQPPRAIS
jgi:hypothetical protein